MKQAGSARPTLAVLGLMAVLSLTACSGRRLRSTCPHRPRPRPGPTCRRERSRSRARRVPRVAASRRCQHRRRAGRALPRRTSPRPSPPPSPRGRRGLPRHRRLPRVNPRRRRLPLSRSRPPCLRRPRRARALRPSQLTAPRRTADPALGVVAARSRGPRRPDRGFPRSARPSPQGLGARS